MNGDIRADEAVRDEQAFRSWVVANVTQLHERVRFIYIGASVIAGFISFAVSALTGVFGR